MEEEKGYNFAKKCTIHPKMKELFPENSTEQRTQIETRTREKYTVLHTNTERFKMSAIPYMQRLLNSEYRKHNIAK